MQGGRALGVRARRSSLLLLLLLWAPAVRAADPHLQLVGQSSIGYTDNAQAAAADEGTGSQRTRSLFWSLSPGFVAALQSARLLQHLAYSYEYDLYFSGAASSSSSHRLEYRGFFDLSPRVSLMLGAGATQSDRFNQVSFGVPGGGVVGALPAGTGSYLSASADQGFSFDVAEGWRAWQSGNVVFNTPLFETEAALTRGIAARAGIERTFLLNAFGLEARGDYTVVTDAVGPAGDALPDQRQLSAGGVALWRHDWGPLLTSYAEAGALRVKRLNTHSGFWTPTGRMSLAYVTEDADAQVSYAHTLSNNALLGQSLLVDEVRLRGALPLRADGKLALVGSGGYQRGRLLDQYAELATRVRVWLLDVSLAWQATDLLELGLRYEHADQKSGADAPPLPVSFVQNNVLLGATLRFPSDRAMPRAYRAPRRVDRTDERRDGMQPIADAPSGAGSAP